MEENKNKNNIDELKPKEESIQDISIVNEMESSFIDYAMSVIVSRAIPDARDGLKPVHRRILYAMEGLDMTHSKPFKKSARAVGEVIAKYHPHGDSAVYDSLVRMAQPFSLRYPLVWGQGNFGSIDGDSAAAMRYTEAKLKKISSLMLEDIKKDTIDFQENYDGSEIEPKVLPSKIPNLLLNGTTGIAVGMATSIPPHNITDVINALIKLLENSETSIDELISIIKAPDFPTGGIIVNKNEISNAYKTGKGRIVIRSKTEINFYDEKNYGEIIITEIPYMVNKSLLIMKIADLVKQKVINSISDIRDESNRKGIRVVIKLKKGHIPEVELNKLFKLTQLQSTFSMNILALVKDRPKKLNLKEVLTIYLEHQIDVLVRRSIFDLNKFEKRKHILDGLKIALDNIDRIIKIIRGSKDNKIALNSLMNEFKLTEIQSKAILEMKLQRLTGLERDNLTNEINELQEQIKNLKKLISSTDLQNEEIKKMLLSILSQYGDERRTEISEYLLNVIDDEDLIPNEDVVITLSNKGYIKRIPINEYRLQNRGGKGSRGAKTNDDDYISNIIISNTHTDLLFFTDYGKVYRMRAHKIPSMSKISKGIPIINLLNIEKDEKIKSLNKVKSYNDIDFIFFTENGIIKRTEGKEFNRVNRKGKIAILLKEGDQLLGVSIVPNNKETEIVIGNSNGKAIKFNSDTIRKTGRATSGVKGMNIDKGKVVGFATFIPKDKPEENNDVGVYEDDKKVLSVSSKGFGKMSSINLYRRQQRGGKGSKTLNVSKAGELISIKSVYGDEDIMIITNKGTVIRTSVEQISESSRNTKGVKLFSLKEEEKISSIAIIPKEEVIEEKIIEKTRETQMENLDNLIKSEIE